MAVTETRTTGYGTRVKNSFGGIWTGFLMFIAGTCILWWNEGRAVKTAQAIEEGREVTEELSDISKINPSNDGKLVHATGEAKSNEQLTDGDFGFTVNAIKLERDIEYYQYVEESSSTSEDKLGGKEVTTTTYTCAPKWTSKPVESANFHYNDKEDYRKMYKNTVILAQPLESVKQTVKNVSFGAYQLSDDQINMISGYMDSELNISDDVLKKYNDLISSTQKAEPAAKVAPVAQQNDSSTAVKDTIPVSPTYKYVHVYKNSIYFGENPNLPAIGDIRITFREVANPSTISIVAQVDNNTFKSYKAKKGKHINLLSMGRRSAEDMYEGQETMNSIWLWVLRILGIMIVCGGLKSMFDFLSTLLKVVPFLSSILNWGVNLICNIIGTAWSIIVIAIAWLFYRPLLTICLLLVAGALVGLFVYRGKIKEMIKEKAKR